MQRSRTAPKALAEMARTAAAFGHAAPIDRGCRMPRGCVPIVVVLVAIIPRKSAASCQNPRQISARIRSFFMLFF
jgi:hypothetical protein